MSESFGAPTIPQVRRELARSREDLSLTFAVSELANASSRVDEVFADGLRLICEHMGWAVGHAFRVTNTDPPRAASTKIWYLAEAESHPKLRALTEEEDLFPLLDRVVGEQSPMVLEPHRGLASGRLEFAASMGLGHHFILPILSGEETVAALEFFSSEPPSGDPEGLATLLGVLGTTLGRVAEREARQRQGRVLARTADARGQAERRAAQLVRVTEELHRRNLELDQFAYAASHDLRAPLRGITNLAGWLAKDLEPHLTDQTRRYFELLTGRVERMEGLISGLLLYSRAGRTALPSEDIDTRALVVELGELHGLDREVEFVLGELPVVTGPRLLLRQVLDNLIGNAVKYAAPHDPRVEVWAERLPADEAWKFIVRDHGPGIAPRHQERIWEIFQTLRPRDEIESTGIGLALVRKIIEERGGRVDVASGPDEGATFTVTWPDPRAEDEDCE